MIRTAFVDDQLLAREFRSGDFVRKTGNHEFTYSPYVGRVLYSNTDIGKVSVQWPWGVESESPSSLSKEVNGDQLPLLTTDQSYSTWESARWISSPAIDKADARWRSELIKTASESAAFISDSFERSTLPVWRAACLEWHRETPELEAMNRISSDFSEEHGFDVVRRTVANVYSLGHRLAIYWKDSNRRYRITQREKSTGKITCPRCGGLLKPRTYRKGSRMLQCKACGFSIHPRDVKLLIY